MSRFMLSPGVHVREIDQSQYASTAPTGNVAALIGYAEKGPFEPTIVGGEQDFEQRFGKTLADSPYLAQTAKKYLAQGSSVLVVRAGDNRDPELYPQAAQYASKTIRIGSSTVPASQGYQEFKRASSLPPGSFAPNTTFEADVVADHRAFAEPKYIETWTADMTWTSANGTPISWNAQPTNLNEGEVKIAMPNETDSSFEIDYKIIHEGNGSFGQYYGTGTRSGIGYGKTLSAMVELYHMDSDYSATGTDGSDNTQLSGQYQAAVVGTTDFASGASWTATPSEFVVGLGTNQYTVALNQDVADPLAAVAFINDTALANATNDNTSATEDISSKLEAFVMSNAAGEAFICLKHISSDDDGFEIISSPFGWQNKTYSDMNTVVGTWRSETTDGSFYEGNVVLKKEGSEQNALSFVDTLTVQATSPTTGSWTLDDIASQVQSSLAAGWTRYPNSEARAVATVDGTTGKVKLTTSMTPAMGQRALVQITSGGGNSLVDLLDGTSAMSVGEPSHKEGESLITLSAAEKGSYGNRLALRVETTEVQKAPGEVDYLYNVFVLLNGKEVTGYQRVSWEDPSSEKYLPTLLENDAYLNMEAEDEDGNSTLVKLPDGTWTLGDDQKADGITDPNLDIVEFKVGTDGYITDDGSIESMSADFVKALEKIYNSEVYSFNLVTAPGDASSIVQNAIVQLCESRRDCFGLIDAAPFGLGLGVKNKINHVSEVNDSVQNINSSYVGAYWPWLQDYDADNKQYIWLPPSTYALAQLAYTDNVADPWFAAAGLRRGKVTALDVEYSPTRSDRDLLYGDTNIVNPIVSLVGEGIAIWGQKTGQRTASATDRINVRRLLIYAEKLIANMARGFLFEPNDESNWSAFARQANGILEPIRQRRGLYQYQVICDETTNTAELINQNTMAGKIFLQPMKTIEFVEVSFTITAYGVEFDEA